MACATDLKEWEILETTQKSSGWTNSQDMSFWRLAPLWKHISKPTCILYWNRFGLPDQLKTSYHAAHECQKSWGKESNCTTLWKCRAYKTVQAAVPRTHAQGCHTLSHTEAWKGSAGMKWFVPSRAIIKRCCASGFPRTTPLPTHVNSMIRTQKLAGSRSTRPVAQCFPNNLRTASQWSSQR